MDLLDEVKKEFKDWKMRKENFDNETNLEMAQMKGNYAFYIKE